MNAGALAEETDHSAVERDNAVRFASLDCMGVSKSDASHAIPSYNANCACTLDCRMVYLKGKLGV